MDDVIVEVDASFVTIVCYISGCRGHQHARTLIDNDSSFHFTEKMIKDVPGFSAEFRPTGGKQFERIWGHRGHREQSRFSRYSFNWDSDDSIKYHQRYLDRVRKLTPLDKRAILVCHANPSQVRFHWPDCDIHLVQVDEEDIQHSIDRYRQRLEYSKDHNLEEIKTAVWIDNMIYWHKKKLERINSYEESMHADVIVNYKDINWPSSQ